jgi:RNA polymerase sigma-70 factor (ECF subfamily)
MNGRVATEQTSRFLDLLEGNSRAIAGVASAYARTPEDRRELIQEMHAQLWRAFPRYDPSRAFSTWLYRVILNVAISHARARWPEADRAAPLEAAAETPAPSVDAPDERAGLLRAFISELDPLNRALMLLYLEDRSHRETGEILGISEANVAKRLSRVKQLLRERMTGGAHGQ